MTRRNFVKAGIGGLAALSAAQGISRAQSLDAGQRIIVIGVDGSNLTVPYLYDYLKAGATVWQYSGNTMDFDRFDEIDNFVNSIPSKVTLAKSYNDILAAKQAGKVAIVAGAQDMYPLDPSWEEGIVSDNPLQSGGNDWLDYPPQTQLSNYYERGLRIANLAYNLSNFFGGGCLDPTTPLSRAGKYLVGQMQEIGILVDTSHSGEQTSLDIVNMATRPVVASHSNPSAGRFGLEPGSPAARQALEQTQDFYRLFLVPGMSHCAGGAGPATFDTLTALEQWVEQGVAPDQILATQYVNNDPTQGVQRTRPLCPYPQISKYNGTGDPNDAANFSCVNDQDDYDQDVANALQSIAANAAFAAAGASNSGSH